MTDNDDDGDVTTDSDQEEDLDQAAEEAIKKCLELNEPWVVALIKYQQIMFAVTNRRLVRLQARLEEIIKRQEEAGAIQQETKMMLRELVMARTGADGKENGRGDLQRRRRHN